MREWFLDRPRIEISLGSQKKGMIVEQIELSKNERFTITLKGLGSAGYRWKYTVDDPRVVAVERLVTKRKPDEGRPPSWSADEHFVVIGLNAGETVVRFSQTRPFEQSKPPFATRDILIRVRKD
jgi:predicted secreted protein